ncbi:hypothetical protein NIES39_D02640 [Arthrospira platensis NIES-39]|nr:hypothetical protein NIES39_D02620 [Arthrospira platensis NIES-39]BAI89683.1 hypothetical protein NIES39_D02630 [Arthrospira platensis NIES-39]BAI89684.1 hypothetical protein NIES39_D02640 [Arthrospira platensis NIES-39]
MAPVSLINPPPKPESDGASAYNYRFLSAFSGLTHPTEIGATSCRGGFGS